MFSIVQGAVLSAIGVPLLGLIGITHILWDWCFFLVGIITVVRYNIASFKHTYRIRMLIWLEKFGDKFSDDEKIYLTEASGIIMPPIMLWSQFFRAEAGAACFWCNLLSVVLFIISLIYGDYGSACVALLIFLSNYGQWPWQPCKFYTGYTDIDTINAISLYYRKAHDKMIYDREKLEAMILVFRITRDRFYYLVDEERKKNIKQLTQDSR